MVKLFGSFFLIACFFASYCEMNTTPVDHPNAKIYGLDLSHHQGDIDWSSVKNAQGHPIQFVYIKATEGATYQDPLYAFNFKEAKIHGFNVGSYHYFRTTSTVANQLTNFFNTVRKDHQTLIPMVDTEDIGSLSVGAFHDSLALFLAGIKAEYGSKPILYTTQRFYNSFLQNRYTDCRFCIGRYGENESQLLDGNPWTIWQFSESAQVNGIPKPVDLNVLNSQIDLGELLLSN